MPVLESLLVFIGRIDMFIGCCTKLIIMQKSYDALTSISMLKCHWISKANALQRRGRYVTHSIYSK